MTATAARGAALIRQNRAQKVVESVAAMDPWRPYESPSMETGAWVQCVFCRVLQPKAFVYDRAWAGAKIHMDDCLHELACEAVRS